MCKNKGDTKMKKSITENLIIEKIMKQHNVTKTLAKKLYINSLLYKVVQNEILNQVNFLIEEKVELI